MGISGMLALTMNDAAARLLGLHDGLLPASLSARIGPGWKTSSEAGSSSAEKWSPGLVRKPRVCWRPQRKRWSVKDPPTSGNKSSVRVTGREPEARGANDTPDHPPQTP